MFRVPIDTSEGDVSLRIYLLVYTGLDTEDSCVTGEPGEGTGGHIVNVRYQFQSGFWVPVNLEGRGIEVPNHIVPGDHIREGDNLPRPKGRVLDIERA